MAPSYGRRGGSARNSNSNHSAKRARPSAPPPSVAPPLHNQEYIIASFTTQRGAKPNPKHLENPKGVLANYITALGESAQYKGGRASVNGVEGYR